MLVNSPLSTFWKLYSLPLNLSHEDAKEGDGREARVRGGQQKGEEGGE